MRSPPTSRAIAARSSVVVTTFSLPCASAEDGAVNTAATARAMISLKVLITKLRRASERVRAVRPDRELELEQELIGRIRLRVAGAAVLTANLAELARPVAQRQR